MIVEPDSPTSTSHTDVRMPSLLELSGECTYLSWLANQGLRCFLAMQVWSPILFAISRWFKGFVLAFFHGGDTIQFQKIAKSLFMVDAEEMPIILKLKGNAKLNALPVTTVTQ